MAMTVLSVLFILGVALLATIGLFASFSDAATRVLLGFVGATLWAVGGISAFSVHSEAYSGAQPMRPLAVTSIGLAAVTLLLALYHLKAAVSQSAGTTSATPQRPGGD